ncbi:MULTISPECIES: DUF5107 domain-containing protein [Arthrobacter]|nr:MULTISPECIES: DUF5107 domain-containing protein [Arthrobacter]
MQNLTYRTIALNMAELGPTNPLPVVDAELNQPYRIGEGVPEELQAAARYGQVPNVFPYLIQDGYSRVRTTHEVPAVVLENSKLRAVVLPTLGGRLWELFDKASGKQLLHTHGTLQFANIALRKAWFAGGLEWNIGTRGHSPTTCDPLHTAVVKTPEGHEVLRMWEFERLRGVVFQVDMWLPEDSDVLLAAVRIRNPHDHEVPMYWWSNAAVPETPETRVVAPAAEAYGSDYTTDVARVRPTEHHGKDSTWLVNSAHAADFFFDIQPGRRHWITAVDRDGDGLAMLSTSLLRGKKLFVWGQGDGGRRWQEWLSPGAGPYAEIQAGLAQTQVEHRPMPARAEWTWVEAYGNSRLDPGVSHGEDWDEAIAHASTRLEHLVPDAALEDALAESKRIQAFAPTEMLVHGSVWGALERVRRRAAGLGWVDEAGTPFGDPTSGETAPWLALLEGRGFAGAESFVAGSDWEGLLEHDGGAEALFHLATMAHARQNLDAAIAHYDAALAAGTIPRRTRALIHRGRARALLTTGNVDEGLAELASVSRLEPTNVHLLIEAMTLSIRHGLPGQALALVSEAPTGMSDVGRLRFLTALALARAGRSDEAAAMLRDGVEIPDIREGEDAISELWKDVCPDEPVPSRYRFRMH